MTKQVPIKSGFGDRTSASEVLASYNLSGKVAIVSGGYSGLGLATTQALCAAGATVLVGARRVEHAQRILGKTKGVEVAELDLGNLSSVARFAQDFVNSGRHADIVINSAGIMACPETRIGNGWEAQFATNHLGHFALVAQLWPALADGHEARVITVSSGAHHNSPIRWDDIHFNQAYDPWLAYGQSKTANALFAVQLDAIGQSHGVRAFSVHPGKIITPLQRYISKQEMVDAGWINADGNVVDPSFKTPAQGAATQVWAATSHQLEGHGGVYCEDCDIAIQAIDDQPGAGVKAHASDPKQAERLWQLSLELCGVNFSTNP